jgi:hypothetical protein
MSEQQETHEKDTQTAVCPMLSFFQKGHQPPHRVAQPSDEACGTSLMMPFHLFTWWNSAEVDGEKQENLTSK